MLYIALLLINMELNKEKKLPGMLFWNIFIPSKVLKMMQMLNKDKL